MPDKRTKVTLPTGTYEGVEVGISESTEKWSEVKLADGSILRIKPNVLGVVRLDNQYDPEGNPLYALRSSQVMTVAEAPAHLRKGGTGGKAN
jgi:hypothetical protein